MRFKATNIAGSQICEECSLPVLSTSLFVFPCLHAFHSNCLCAHVISRTVDMATRRNIERLELASKVLQYKVFSGAPPSHAMQAAPDGAAAAELDELVGSDCPLCGECICGVLCYII